MEDLERRLKHSGGTESLLFSSKVAWPSGLRRWFKAPVSSEAWVRIPPLPRFFFFLILGRPVSEEKYLKLSNAITNDIFTSNIWTKITLCQEWDLNPRPHTWTRTPGIRTLIAGQDCSWVWRLRPLGHPDFLALLHENVNPDEKVLFFSFSAQIPFYPVGNGVGNEGEKGAMDQSESGHRKKQRRTGEINSIVHECKGG